MTTTPARLDRHLLVGAALVAVYLVVAAFTLPGPLGLRPLFDGFSGPPPYRWVNPPKELAGSNQRPSRATKTIPLGPNGSASSDTSTDDGQVLLSLPDGGLAPHPPDTAAVAAIDPIDPATLAPLPAPYTADGNAYHVTLTYTPSNTPVPEAAKQGSILLRYPSVATVMLFSPDGKAWQPIDTVPSPGNLTVLGQFRTPGYYIAALNETAKPKSKSKGVNPLVIGAEIVGALVVVGIVVSLFRRPGQGQAKRPAPKKRPPPKKRRR
ncbi:MAG: hypothetical protein QOG64_2794 [Acidimicrobiaceae bacterium]|nr:hypothetical protein [Acidimicrobiaceae bacterium]